MPTPIDAPYKIRQRQADYEARTGTIVAHKNPALVGKKTTDATPKLARFLRRIQAHRQATRVEPI